MRGLRDLKTMAKTLRTALAEKGLALSHSECLELVARQMGHADWNTAAAVTGIAPEGMKLPLGWVVGGNAGVDYDVGVDQTKPGKPASIRSLHEKGDQTGFATLMQVVDAAPFRGKKVRLRAELSSKDATGAATLWMRVDDQAKQNIRLDNMELRRTNGPITGTQDWVLREIVLDVPQEGHALNYGFYLRGRGQCWARSFSIETVGNEVPTTSDANVGLAEPKNLDFAEV